MTYPSSDPAGPVRVRPPLAQEIARDLAIAHGGCIRPIQVRRTNLATGQVEHVMIPCGHTLASVCPACAERKKQLRAAQCREGWHLEDEPDLSRADPDDTQQLWIGKRPRRRPAATTPRRPATTRPRTTR